MKLQIFANGWGADVNEVADAVGLDKRIGRAFLNAGLGWGGSCFPKDVAALQHLARSAGYQPEILGAISSVNDARPEAFVGKIKKVLKGLKNKTIAIFGLAFKPNTDDLREAPSLKVIKFLLAEGAKIQAYDPVVKNLAQVAACRNIVLCRDPYQASQSASAVAIVTEWHEFSELDYRKIKGLMKAPYIFDARNVLPAARLRELGFHYTGVGR
jgi:UDPglucose 6-dehydrogenase